MGPKIRFQQLWKIIKKNFSTLCVQGKIILNCNEKKLLLDNNNWRAGRLEGHVSKWKTWIFDRLHRRQKGGLQKRAVRWAAEKDGAACRKGQPSGPSFSATRLNVQPTSPSCSAACRLALLCSLPAPGKFMFFIWQHGPPFSVIRFFLYFYLYWLCDKAFFHSGYVITSHICLLKLLYGQTSVLYIVIVLNIVLETMIAHWWYCHDIQ